MIVSCDKKGIKIASNIVKKGGTVVFPTDTVYGLGCDPRNPDAVKAIYGIKKRSKLKQLPVLGFSKKEISRIAYFDELSERIADKFWPGPVTLILKVSDKELANSLNLGSKVAVRVPNHPCALLLLKECKLLVGTSANFSGQSPFINSSDIIAKFSGFDVLLDGGKILDTMESTVVEVVGNTLKIIRRGKVEEKELTSVI